MKDKRGVAGINISNELIIEIVAALFFIIILFFAWNSFASIMPKSGVQCLNTKWWDDKGGLKDMLKEVDKAGSKEFMFYNNDCNLVSFSFTQGPTKNKIEFPYPLPKEPQLCLCKIEASISEPDLCKPYDCYKFKNYDQINEEQFSTKDMKDYVGLKFIKDGKTLRIETVGTEKPIEPIEYKKSETQTKTDEEGLINNLVVLFSSREIKQFTPIIRLKDQGFLLPEEVDNVGGFTMFFDLELALPPSYGQTEDDYLTDHKTIDPNMVQKAFIQLSIKKEKLDSLSKYQQDSIVLYYKKGQEWKSSYLECKKDNEPVLCSAVLNGFSSNFAISTTSAESLQEEESQQLVGEVQPIEISEEGNCKDFAEGLIPIPQDDKIKCEYTCCAKPEIISQLKHTKEFILGPAQALLISDAARTPSSQRDAFLAFLAGRAEACGPKDITNKYNLEKKVPNIEGAREERIGHAREWLQKNDPQILDIINELSQYSHCRHIQGLAIDVQLQTGKSDSNIQKLRNLMCEAGWANYGAEWWHYEYLTKGYEEAKSKNNCYFSEDKYANLAATVTPGYA